MKPFVPKKENKDFDVVPFAIPKTLNKKLDDMSALTQITKQNLMRQMIQHCLNTFEFEPSKERKTEREDF